MQLQSVTADQFNFVAGLPIFLIAVIGGLGSVGAGLFTGRCSPGRSSPWSALWPWTSEPRRGAARPGRGRVRRRHPQPARSCPDAQGLGAGVCATGMRWPPLLALVRRALGPAARRTSSTAGSVLRHRGRSWRSVLGSSGEGNGSGTVAGAGTRPGRALRRMSRSSGGASSGPGAPRTRRCWTVASLLEVSGVTVAFGGNGRWTGSG